MIIRREKVKFRGDGIGREGIGDYQRKNRMEEEGKYSDRIKTLIMITEYI